MWHSTGPMDNRRYQVQVQQTNKGKHALQGSKPHPETQQKRGICCKTESKRRPKKTPKTYSLQLLFNPKNRLVILNKISKFGENYSLWQVTGVKKKKKSSRSKIKAFGSLSPSPFVGHCRRCKGKHLRFISPHACTELKLFPPTSI